MKDYLKEYEVVLETVGPVFIGSGKEFNKKEYILKPNEAWIMDMQRLFTFFSKKHLTRQFESFFLDDFRKDLSGFLRESNIQPKEVEEYIKYRIRQTDTALERGTKISVMEFSRDPYGMAYVPGSSIKGMLRTILLSDSIINSKGKYIDAKSGFENGLRRGGNRNTFLRSEQKQIETVAFNTLGRNDRNKGDAVNDVLSGLRISDSKPIPHENMVLCQRIEYHMDGTEKRLNVLRECLMPRTKIYFTLTVDETICPYSPEDILRGIESFNKVYNTAFRNKFAKITDAPNNTVYLGGGVGFASKTTVYPLLGQAEGVNAAVTIFENTRVPKEHKHYLDRKMGISPHILKTARYEGKLYQIGECRWEFV